MTRAVRVRSGSSLRVDDAGHGPAVLALHGVGGGAYFFGGLAERLGAYRVIAADLPGTGGSTSAHEAFTLDTWTEDLGDLVEETTDTPVVLVGHSLGTMLALKAWQRWPDRIRGIVFVGGVPEVRPVVRERLESRIKLIQASGNLRGWGEKVSQGVFSASSRARMPEVVALFETLFETEDPRAYVRSLEVLLGARTAAAAPTVTVPTLAITGAEDQYAPPDAVKAFIGTIPSQPDLVIVPHSAHMPFFEAPEAFAGALRQFLDGC